jgi:hypothetical protein
MIGEVRPGPLEEWPSFDHVPGILSHASFDVLGCVPIALISSETKMMCRLRLGLGLAVRADTL